MMRCLWLSRTLPFPWTAGDRIYSAKLAQALAAAGAEVTFAGLAADSLIPVVPNVQWNEVPGGPRGRLASLASRMPLVAARHATPAYHAAVAKLARDHAWDAVIIDYYGMGWILAHRHEFVRRQPVFVLVTHNHEASVTDLQWRDRSASPAIRAYLLQNHIKARWFERRTARACDLITAITQTDASLFDALAPGCRTLVLLPGHDGPRRPLRRIDDRLPRVVLMFGSYRWSAKQASLRCFLDRADDAFAAAGIRIRVVGDMDVDMRRALAERYRAVEAVGYVDAPEPYLAAARLAVVAEPIGGGFKLKLLEYIFNRIPVAALGSCAAGLPAPLRKHMLLEPNIDALTRAVVDVIDDTARLDAMQLGAFASAEHAFDWNERGTALHAAISVTRDRLARTARVLP